MQQTIKTICKLESYPVIPEDNDSISSISVFHLSLLKLLLALSF